jgi:hypothetical protein
MFRLTSILLALTLSLIDITSVVNGRLPLFLYESMCHEILHEIDSSLVSFRQILKVLLVWDLCSASSRARSPLSRSKMIYVVSNLDTY